jgi:hypothetical protein
LTLRGSYFDEGLNAGSVGGSLIRTFAFSFPVDDFESRPGRAGSLGFFFFGANGRNSQ